jgi:UDPglucose 6-dehydrogenase
VTDTKVGWLGLGRLGLPCALTLARYGERAVVGYDPVVRISEVSNPDEPGLDAMLADPDVSLTQVDLIEDVVLQTSGLIFVAVQTPHSAAYEGITPMPDERRDFDYSFLKDACGHVCRLAESFEKEVTLVIISTVLPGTLDREIRPLLNRYVTLIYNPFFIAMGTTVYDYMHPEFVLIGADDGTDTKPLETLYDEMHDSSVFICSIPSAELIKVTYNTFISAKILFANTIMEICHKTAADVGDVLVALSYATDRVISNKYMRGGMGDGGACHPRDLIAMSWLSERLDLSHDLYGSMVRGREEQTRWIAELVLETVRIRRRRIIVILGKSYKSKSNLTFGSPALLLRHYLEEMLDKLDRSVRIVQWDPYVDHYDMPVFAQSDAVYVIATDHPEFRNFTFEAGAVVVDPWRRVTEQSDRTVIRIGG